MATSKNSLDEVKKHLDAAVKALYPKRLLPSMRQVRMKWFMVIGDATKGQAGTVNTLVSLQAALNALTHYIRENEKAAKEIANKKDVANDQNERIRKTEDDLDDEKQKNLKGKFMLLSSDKYGKPSLIKGEDVIENGTEKKTLVDHVSDLVFLKYNFRIPDTEFSSCYRLHNGGIIFSLWNLTPGSAFSFLCSKIKSRENLETNIFFNFMLTKRRSTLLYEARQMKKTGRIDKFFSDENGSISVKVGEEKQKIAGEKSKSGVVKTYRLEELKKQYTVSAS